MTDVVLIGSVGGHLRDLYEVSEHLEANFKRVFITFYRSGRLLDKNHVYITDPKRSPFRYILNFLQALWLILKLRPRMVISSGAGVVIPFCLLSRIVGVRVVHVELACQVYDESMTGRILRMVRVERFCQSSHLVRLGYRYVGNVFDSYRVEKASSDRNPPKLLFIAMGNHPQKVPRAIRLIEIVVSLFPTCKVVAQLGDTEGPILRNCEYSNYISRDRFLSYLKRADVSIVHGGVGVAKEALELGVFPILMPRLVNRGEHTDPSQPIFSSYLESLGLAQVLPENFSKTDVLESIKISLERKVCKIDEHFSFGRRFVDMIGEIDGHLPVDYSRRS